MKLLSTIAAGAVAAAALVCITPAGAQTRVVRTRTVVTHRTTVRPHHYRTRRVCHTYYSHHRRLRRCRVERY